MYFPGFQTNQRLGKNSLGLKSLQLTIDDKINQSRILIYAGTQTISRLVLDFRGENDRNFRKSLRNAEDIGVRPFRMDLL